MNRSPRLPFHIVTIGCRALSWYQEACAIHSTDRSPCAAATSASTTGGVILQPNRKTLIVRASRISLAVVWFLVLGLLYGESVVWGSAWLAPLTWFND